MAGTLFQDNLSPYLTIVEQGSTPANPSAGDQKLFIRTSDHLLCYVNSSGTVTPVSAAGSGSITSSGYTQNTARLLGRTTASAGAIEEISVGSGLTLSAGSLSASGSAGALTLLEQHAASTSASLDFTTFISSTYDDYLIEGVALVPVSSGASLVLQIGTGAGPTYDTGTNYYSAITAHNSSGSTTQSNANPGAGTLIAGPVANSAGYGYLSFSGRLFDPQNTSIDKQFCGTSIFHDGTSVCPATFGGLWVATTAVTAVRFLMSTGNLASGTIRAYGIAK